MDIAVLGVDLSGRSWRGSARLISIHSASERAGGRSLIKDLAPDSTNGRLSRQIGQYDASRGEQTHAASPRHLLTAALGSVPAHLDRKPNIEIKHAPMADKANA
jgi:hypothetical protein